MSSSTIPFGELYEVPSRNGVTRPSRVRGAGYKMVNMGELFQYNRIGDIEMERVPMSDEDIEKTSIESGDLLFARQSLVLEGAGKCSIVLQAPEPTTFESHLIRVRLKKDICDPFFYYHYFNSRQSPISTIVQQCAQAGIRGSELAKLHVLFPDLPIQQKIASILSSYDDLIENNNRRIKLLEESARLLYQEWFVRLRFPGYEHTRIVDGVPEGWRPRTLGDICFEVREIVNPSELEPDTPYIGLEHIPRRSICLDTWGRAEEVTSTKHNYIAGDILFGKIRPYFHKVGIAFTDGIASSDAIVMRPITENLRSLLLLTISSDRFVAVASKTAREGSKMPRADWNLMKQYPVPIPPEGMLDAFNGTIVPIIEQLKLLAFQNQKLKAARDLLLPRLMSGEIAV